MWRNWLEKEDFAKLIEQLSKNFTCFNNYLHISKQRRSTTKKKIRKNRKKWRKIRKKKKMQNARSSCFKISNWFLYIHLLPWWRLFCNQNLFLFCSGLESKLFYCSPSLFNWTLKQRKIRKKRKMQDSNRFKWIPWHSL